LCVSCASAYRVEHVTYVDSHGQVHRLGQPELKKGVNRPLDRLILAVEAGSRDLTNAQPTDSPAPVGQRFTFVTDEDRFIEVYCVTGEDLARIGAHSRLASNDEYVVVERHAPIHPRGQAAKPAEGKSTSRIVVTSPRTITIARWAPEIEVHWRELRAVALEP
jgi:hypothetical protein